MNSKSSIVRDVERSLGSRYVGDLASGHMGATLVRLRSCQDGSFFVAKFCPDWAPQSALEDFRANVNGYAGIRKAGAATLLPTGYRVLQLHGTSVIVMDDLGRNLRLRFASKNCRGHGKWLLDHFRMVVTSTITGDKSGRYGAESWNETLAYISLYAKEMTNLAPEMSAVIRRMFAVKKIIPLASHAALFLLDFTPSNLFVSKERVSFIDPWEQKSYLGNSAISIGQFVTLVRDVHRIEGAAGCVKGLLRFAYQELPVLLGCDVLAVEQAYRLGCTLQYVLSSYVRRKSDPALALRFINKAQECWS